MARAFSLVELLVVITILVVLLALLMPALDQAIYQAELARCGANTRGIAQGATIYSADYRRFYPHRPGVEPAGNAWHPHKIWSGSGTAQDDRPIIRDYISVNGLLLDPLEQEVDLANSRTGSQTYAGYFLWYGYRYAGHAGIKKIGDRLAWRETGANGQAIDHRFEYLASDMDDIRLNNGNTFNSHPDNAGTLVSKVYQDTGAADVGLEIPAGNWTLARWESSGGSRRGGTDMNYAAADGSVTRLKAVLPNADAQSRDERMVKVPTHDEGTEPETVQQWAQLPRQR